MIGFMIHNILLPYEKFRVCLCGFPWPKDRSQVPARAHSAWKCQNVHDRLVHALVGVPSLQQCCHIWRHRSAVVRTVNNCYASYCLLSKICLFRMYTAKATVTAMNASFGGGFVGLASCYLLFGGKIYVPYISNSVLGSLVSITCCSFLVPTWAAFVIGNRNKYLLY